jgi:predicted negative regulator of RcsB-dependent stress response
MHLGAFLAELGFWTIAISLIGAGAHLLWRWWGKRQRS